jgi:hypothetical protein
VQRVQRFDGPYGPRVVVGACGASIKAALRRRPPLVPVGTTFAPLGSVSLDFRVTAFPYKSSSLATPLKRWDYGR